MDVSIYFLYWHEKAGPMILYSKGNHQIDQEELFLLLSMVEPFCSPCEATISGPYPLDKHTAVVYNTKINNPEAKDKRIRFLGTDCWMILLSNFKHEKTLVEKMDIIKMILDMDFSLIQEIDQLTTDRVSQAGETIVDFYKEQ
ncbi:MAG: hypothetical protein GF308_17345 [Candidatus Heimdallarchaeota archaeon]|nr:hypothetical protein [Candidatus Heimdallarchaeota archaeon]